MCFQDELRKIDYILAWTTHKKPEEEAKAAKAREVFEKNLTDEGLELEYHEADVRWIEITCFQSP